MYYPLVASFCAEGDYDSARLGEGFVHAMLRRGNCAGAEGAVRFARETIGKARELACHLDVRIDAGLVNGRTLEAIDDEGACFVGRLKNNARLDRLAQPPVAPAGPAGTFEANEATLLTQLLAFNLAGMIRGELEDDSASGWDLKRLQRTLLKTGAKVAKHSGRLLVDISRAAGVLWGRVLARVARWWRDASWGRDPSDRRRGPRPRRWVPPPSHAHLSLVLRE
jgi:hypothetical protein